MKENEIEGGKNDIDRSFDRLLIEHADLEPGHSIGKGSFGEVMKGRYRGHDVAVKVINDVTGNNMERFRAEIFRAFHLTHQPELSSLKR